MDNKVIVFIASSLDGYISKPNDDLSFLDIVKTENQDYGYEEFFDTVETVVIGKKTFDFVSNMVVGYPYKDKCCYVITHQEKTADDKITFYNGDLYELFDNLKKNSNGNIFVDGGANLINQLFRLNLIDEIIISIIPVILGNGLKLFESDIPENKLELIDIKHYNSNLVQLKYKIIR